MPVVFMIIVVTVTIVGANLLARSGWFDPNPGSGRADEPIPAWAWIAFGVLTIIGGVLWAVSLF